MLRACATDVVLRDTNLARLAKERFDVLVVGAGINGAASAAALAARGASVALIDSRDFAGFTSQHSSNLVWGGIKYLENLEVSLVWELCKSRNELMRSYPSAIREVRFLTTVSKRFRHAPWMLWAGAWLYWLFGRGYTRTPRYHSPASLAAAEPLIDTARSRGGIEYSDAYLPDNDARFVFSFVRAALEHGCATANYVSCTAASRDPDGGWRVQAQDQHSGESFPIHARVLINAGGAFVDDLNGLAGITTTHQHLFSKGIHLLVPRLGSEERVLAFFADDGRLFFAIPMGDCTCIGTTDTRVDSPATEVTDADRAFVLDNINARLALPRALTTDDVIAERCGVRPLAVRRGDAGGDDFLRLSRKHIIEVDAPAAHLSIFGGKLTDCLNIGDEVSAEVARLGVALKHDAERWYGEQSEAERAAFMKRARGLQLDGVRAEDTGERLSERLWRRYGARAHRILDDIEADRSLVSPVIDGAGLSWCEIAYIRDHEMVTTLEDLLRRRSRLGLLLKPETLGASDGLAALSEALFGPRGDAQRARFLETLRSTGVSET